MTKNTKDYSAAVIAPDAAQLARLYDEGLNIGVPSCRIQSRVYGGPYRDFIMGQRRLHGVKMAAEIKAVCAIDVPTEDFSVPDPAVLEQGVIQAFTLMAQGQDLYVGCMGGTGRTGLFMACLVKVAAALNNEPMTGKEAVAYVRRYYRPHAVEMDSQHEFITNFDVSLAVEFLRSQYAPQVKYVDRKVEVPKVILPWDIPLSFIKAFFGELRTPRK